MNFRRGNKKSSKKLIKSSVFNSKLLEVARERSRIRGFHDAIRLKYVTTVEMLLRMGLDINAVNKRKETALHIAVSHSNKAMINLLLDNGADVNAKDKEGYTALHRAVFRKKEGILELLLRSNQDKEKRVIVDAEDNYGCTPLYFSSYEPINCIKLLIENKADVNYKTKNQLTPFEYAAVRCSLIFEIYLECGVDINTIFNSKIEYPNFFRIGCRNEVKVIIERHITKMKVAGFYLNEYLKELGSIFEALPFHKECEEEVERMKQKISGTTISFHDILLNRSGKTVYGNENIELVFESDNYKMAFPIYASMIERQYRKGVQRQKLLEETSHVFNIFKNVLPHVCIDKIISYFTNDDLKILKDAL